MFEFSRKSVICDIGAALIGDHFPYQTLMDAGLARVIGFEPDEVALERLKQLPGDHEFLPYFIGNDGEHMFHINDSALTSSLLPTNTPFINQYQNIAHLMVTNKVIPCKTVTLDFALGDRPVDFMKIDVQGAAKLIVENAPAVMSRCPLVEVEVEFNPLYKNQPLFGDVDQVMRGYGFMLYQIKNKQRLPLKPLQLDQTTIQFYGQEGWCDAIYVPDHNRFEMMDYEDAIRLAALSSLVFNAHDYTLHLLQKIDAKFKKNMASKFYEDLRHQRPFEFTIAGQEGHVAAIAH